MKLTLKDIKEIEDCYALVTFEKEPEVGDSFTVGEVTFVAKKKEYKIVVL